MVETSLNQGTRPRSDAGQKAVDLHQFAAVADEIFTDATKRLPERRFLKAAREGKE